MWSLTVSAPGFTEQVIPWAGPDGFRPIPSTLTVSLHPAIPVAGEIRDAEGAPVSGMDVCLLAMDLRESNAPQSRIASARVKTGADGSFRARVGIPEGDPQWQLGIGGTWCRGLPVKVPADAEAVQFDPISLADGVRVGTRVLGADSTPLPNAVVRAIPAGTWWFYSLAVKSDPRGRYLLPWVPKGKAEIRAELESVRGQRSVDLEGDRTVDIEIR